ncbi:MAG: hypothetical protein PHN49_00480 [Candidatus Omnitrophica bacterium]|nr:hypothetical protein [Candidatus Omnitrophota bacterium]
MNHFLKTRNDCRKVAMRTGYQFGVKRTPFFALKRGEMAAICFCQNMIFAIRRFRVLLLRKNRLFGAKHPSQNTLFLMRGIKTSSAGHID